MKKLMFVALLAVAPAAFAVNLTSVNVSSYIAGGTQTGCIQATYLDKIMVGTTSSGNLMLFNSTWTTNAPIISSFSLTVGNPVDYENLQVNGLCYIAATPTNGVSIIYKK